MSRSLLPGCLDALDGAGAVAPAVDVKVGVGVAGGDGTATVTRAVGGAEGKS